MKTEQKYNIMQYVSVKFQSQQNTAAPNICHF